MEVKFPHRVKIQQITPHLSGMRHSPFVNIDNQIFARPRMDGQWRVDMSLSCHCEEDLLALSGFLMAMRGYATTLIPMTTQYLPRDNRGVPINGFSESPEWAANHVGWDYEPYDGFTLRAAASVRDSYIDINKPMMSMILPGHYITLGERLHQVINVTHIDEEENSLRLDVMPNLRDDYAQGEIVIVDKLRLKAFLEEGDDVVLRGIPTNTGLQVSFLEAF